MDLQQGEEYLGALCIPLRLQQAAVWGDKAPGGTQKIFSLTPRLYCQLFWQEMCRNLPPSVILCETSWLSISILILKWLSAVYLNSDMSVWGHVRFRRLRAQPHKTIPPLPVLIAGPGCLCVPPPLLLLPLVLMWHVRVPGGGGRAHRPLPLTCTESR